MNRNNRPLRWTALAIATAMIVAPVAHSGGKHSTVYRPGATALGSKVKPGGKAVAPRYDRFIVTYRKGAAARMTAATQARQLGEAARAAGVGIAPMRTLATGALLVRTDRKLDKKAMKQLVQALSRDTNVLAVEPDVRLTRQFVPNDPLYAQQWHYKDGPGGINLEPALDISKGDGVVVAVLDTGITPHPDLDANIIDGYDFISGDPDGSFETARDGDGRDPDPNDPGDWHDGECNIFGIPEDSSWHGTHVAGTVAASTDNGAGVAGVAPNAKVQPVRVLGKCGGYLSDISDAIVWASGGSVADVADNPTPAEVINLSLGGSGSCSVAMQTAIDGATSRGTTVVVAAGNSGSDAEGFTPANCNNVVAVSAVGPSGDLTSYSNFGDTVDLAAPGGTASAPAEDNILSTLNLGTQEQGEPGYAWYAGTSMSSPHVAGVVALMQAAAASPKTPAEVETILRNTAYASGGFAGGCSYEQPCGAGILDARHAVAVAAGLEPLPSDPPPPPPPPPGIELENGVTVTGIEVAEDDSIVYQLEVPNGASHLLFGMFGGTGDADLYVRHGERPTDTAYDCRPFKVGNDESCYFPAPESGVWFVRIKGFTDASGISLYPSFVDANWPRGEAATVKQLKRHRTRVTLTWEEGKRRVDIWRDGSIYATRRNNGVFVDRFRIVGSGSKTYKICNQGTLECSNEVQVDFESHR